MLRWLLQWLNKLLKLTLSGRQIHNLGTVEGYKVVNSPPELTNADLEFLFTQLLEGVHQGRGQQWALTYLQRVEHRISTERWIDWLLIFGERLLASPAPNYQLAAQMVQLGELGIGKLGELAYEIGIQLLRQELTTEYEDNEEPYQVESSNLVEALLNTPGQDLLRSLGEKLWEYDQEEVVTPSESKSTDKLGELVREYKGEETTTPPAPILTPFEVDETSQLESEAVGEVAASSQKNTSDKSLIPVDPNLASTLDTLLSKLDENTHLVQQLASELATQRSDGLRHASNDHQAIIERPINNLSVTNQAQTWFYQGLQKAKTGDLLGAISAYEQALELQPDSSEYWFNRGLTLFHLKDFAGAIASYDRAIEFKPDFYKAWYNRGGTQGELGDFDAAVASFDKVLEINPDYPQAWSSRGLALLRLGLVWEAIASYDQALRLQPQDPENFYYRGIALAVNEQYEEAIASYDQSLAIQPDYYEVWIDRGVVLFNLNRWSEAIDSWDQALSIQPDLYLAWYNRGIALDNLERREEAIASYQKAIAIKSDFHLAWYNQAVAMFYLERFTEAIASYDGALQIKRDYWEAWIGRGAAAGNLVNIDKPLRLSSSIAVTNPALNLGGYEGKLASYEEGLKYLRQDTHPEGWGRLHLAIGNTHYERGKKHPTPRTYWYEAVAEYEQALLTLTAEDFPQLHLEVLQSLVKVLVCLGQTAPAWELQQRGIDVLRQLLSESTRPDETKKQLALKFAGLGQLAVDLALDAGDVLEAWEIAEQGKNTCLTWLLSGWSYEIYSPKYRAIQQLLNPTTAIVYWHISPAALHTFILKDEAPSPILLFTPMQEVGSRVSGELPLPEAVQRLVKFEKWLEDWQQEFQEYRQQGYHQEDENNHSWRVDMELSLLHLQDILNISTIIQELEGIEQLILVPHRDLYKLPLHTLFHLSSPSQENWSNVATDFTITYLPTIQLGISAKTESIPNWQQQVLLSVEQPNSTGYSPLKFAKFESEIISQIFDNSQRIQGAQATKDNVTNALGQNYNIFHFTGHAINNCHELKNTELLLAGDDKLSLEEIYQQPLSSYNLVTFSACETVISKSQTINSEYVSLATALLYRGIPHVVTTLWNVDAAASGLVMIEFYRRLQFNQSPASALTEATIWLKELTAGDLTKWYESTLNSLHPEEFRIRTYLASQMYRSSKLDPNKKLYNHPYYWSTFIIAGNLG